VHYMHAMSHSMATVTQAPPHMKSLNLGLHIEPRTTCTLCHTP
jgi:hypothetical protein